MVATGSRPYRRIIDISNFNALGTVFVDLNFSKILLEKENT